MKKILTLLLIFSILIPSVAFGEAAPEQPPDVSKYIKNPKVDKPKLTLVPERPLPTQPPPSDPNGPKLSPSGALRSLGLLGSLALLTPYGQNLVNAGAEKLEELDYELYYRAVALKDETASAFSVIDQNLDKGIYSFVEFTQAIYDDFMLTAYSIDDSVLQDLPFESTGEIDTYNVPLPGGAVGTFVFRPTSAVVGDYEDSQGRRTVFYIRFYPWDGRYQAQSRYVRFYPNGTTLDDIFNVYNGSRMWVYNKAMESAKMNYEEWKGTYPVHRDYYKEVDSTPYRSEMVKPEGMTVPALPSFYEKTPAIVEIDNTKYWEIPKPNPQYNPDEVEDPWNNPVTIPEYVPIDNPSAEPIPDIIPNPDVDPTPEPDPNETPDGDTGTDPPAESGGLWDWLKNLLDKILEWLRKIWEAITGLVAGIINGISALFIPSADFWSGSVVEMQSLIREKLPLIGQLADFIRQVKDTTINATIPEFLIDIPKDWGGGTYPIIDFSYFTEYRTWILNFIRFSAWFFFLKKLYNRIPKIIY